eukprot:gene22484-29610_t
MKIRMSSLDVAGEVACLKQRLLGLRVANVYDLNSKTYVLKMARSGEDGEKIFLLLESGSRFHTSEVTRAKSSIPSNFTLLCWNSAGLLGPKSTSPPTSPSSFVMGAKSDIPSNFTLKLRKHMRTRRLEDVRQLGVDRIVDFVFGSGEAQYHLILEITLTPCNSVLCYALATSSYDLAAAFVNAAEGSTMKAAPSQPGFSLWGPAVAAHVIADAGLDAGAVVPHPGGLPQDQLDALLAAGRRLEGWFTSLETSAPKGFITWEPAGQGKAGGGKKKEKQEEADEAPEPTPVAEGQGKAGGGKKKKKQEEAEVAPEPTLVAEGDAGAEVVKLYNDFNPLLLQQSKAKPYLEFENFDKALDNFFSSIAGHVLRWQKLMLSGQPWGSLIV